MSRNKKIIVSISGIIIITIALIGFTYAYFITNINGNTNTKSIEVSTADLKLTYSDGNSSILSVSNISPGIQIGSKSFTIENTGNTKVSNYIVYLENVVNTFKYTNDITYSLTCTSSDGETCNGINNAVYPKTDSILVKNDIGSKVIQSYTMTLNYLESGIDQSEDMNKKIDGKINVYDIKSLPTINTSASANATLAYNIINKAKVNSNSTGTNLVASPNTMPITSTSLATDRELSVSNDDYGVTYYYRGNVIDNYVNFANMCWRIVRIQGDGSIKLVLDDKNQTCSSSMTGNFGLNIGTNNVDSRFIGGIYNKLGENNVFVGPFAEPLNTFQTSISSYLSKLKEENWCYEDILEDNTTIINNMNISNTFDSTKLLSNKHQLNCLGTKLNRLVNDTNSMYVGMLTANEVRYAGNPSLNYYLHNSFLDAINSDGNSGMNYWFTMTPSIEHSETNVFFYLVADKQPFGIGATLSSYNDIWFGDGTNNSYIRPSVVLKNDVSFTGNGTLDNPYIIN